MADSMASSAASFSPYENINSPQFTIEMAYRPSVPDNVNHWQVLSVFVYLIQECL